MDSWSRRHFLHFIGAAGAASALPQCSTGEIKLNKTLSPVTGLPKDLKKDDVTLSEGLSFEILIKEGDTLGSKIKFGTNNDYIHFVDLKDGRFGLWVNHESLEPYLLHGRRNQILPTKRMLKKERDQVGGSFFEIKQDPISKQWSYVPDSPLNFRLSANTKIPFSRPINGANEALGTLANCAGGYTPWGTVLTCEENYDHFYGEALFSKKGRSIKKHSMDLGWADLDQRPPEHYGWVVEIVPSNKSAEKLINLGRFAHESATVVVSKGGYPVVYSGDDRNNEHLYKFVSSRKDSIKEGTLYVAQLETGRWLPLDINSDPRLKEAFKDQTELLVRTREAAKILGATPLDRPEDIEVDPKNGDVYVALTNNKAKGNYHGSILKIKERDKKDLKFKHETFKSGGAANGFSCPDNMVFDKNGNLWLTSDISGGSIGKGAYAGFGNNALFLIPRRGKQAGEVIKIASAPNDAEFTGPCFSADEKTLFLSVQHPGEKTKNIPYYTSNWPSKKKRTKPRSAVIAITGSLIDEYTL